MYHVPGAGHDATGVTLLNEGLLNTTAGKYLNAGLHRRVGHCLSNCHHAHPPHVPTCPCPVTLAKDMVQKYVGRTMRIGAGADAVETKQRLDRCALEPTVQILGGRDGEKIQQFLPQPSVQLLQLASEPTFHSSGSARSQPPDATLGGACKACARNTSA